MSTPTGLEEELSILSFFDQGAGGINVARANEDRVGIHAMFRNRYRFLARSRQN